MPPTAIRSSRVYWPKRRGSAAAGTPGRGAGASVGASGAAGAGAAAWSIRRDFATVTTRMVVDEPVFGVGIGRFYDESSKYMPESLRRTEPGLGPLY